MNWLTHQWETLTWERILFGGGVFLFTMALNIFAIFIVIIKIPADYFSPNYTHHFLPGRSWYVRWSAVILKNLLGFTLLIVGIIMLIGPGQGILTILLALIMLDIPGKRPLESKIIQRPTVKNAIDKIRLKYNKPPLTFD